MTSLMNFTRGLPPSESATSGDSLTELGKWSSLQGLEVFVSFRKGWPLPQKREARMLVY